LGDNQGGGPSSLAKKFMMGDDCTRGRSGAIQGERIQIDASGEEGGICTLEEAGSNWIEGAQSQPPNPYITEEKTNGLKLKNQKLEGGRAKRKNDYRPFFGSYEP